MYVCMNVCVYICMLVYMHDCTYVPGAPLTNFNDGGGVGGPTEVNILYPKQEAAGSLYWGRSNQFFVVSQ